MPYTIIETPQTILADLLDYEPAANFSTVTMIKILYSEVNGFLFHTAHMVKQVTRIEVHTAS
jgi:hypothetical protein